MNDGNEEIKINQSECIKKEILDKIVNKSVLCSTFDKRFAD